MTKGILAVTLTALITATVTGVLCHHLGERVEPAEGIVEGTLPSVVLAEERSYRVLLPESYRREPGRRYPVLYVLDGSSQDLHTARSAALLARIGVMPEVLVVGIPNASGPSRQRDYTPPGMRQDLEDATSPEGGADRFLAFLREELIPRIDAEYPTARLRMLAGNSRGGLFAVYSLLAAPDLFDARFAHSPALWRDGGALVERLGRFLASPPPLESFLFLSLGAEENEKMTAAFHRAVAVLEGRAPRGLQWRAELRPGADHGNNAQLSTPVGLYAMFAGEPRPTVASAEGELR